MPESPKNIAADTTDLSHGAKTVGLWLGPAVFLIIYFFIAPAGMPASAISVMAITAWIAIWWVTEPIPLAATSLIPIILFPLMGILKLSQTTASYGQPIVFLYIGGFLIAIAIEKTGLHRRIAVNIIRSIKDMVKSGFWLNIASVIIITCVVYFLLGPMWGL